MKTVRNIKLRTFSSGPIDLALMKNNNPLKHSVEVERTQQSSTEFLNQYKVPIDPHSRDHRP